MIKEFFDKLIPEIRTRYGANASLTALVNPEELDKINAHYNCSDTLNLKGNSFGMSYDITIYFTDDKNELVDEDLSGKIIKPHTV